MAQTIVTVNGSEAIDYVLSIHPHSDVYVSSYTFDCDTPGNISEDEKSSDMGWMLWHVLQYRDEPDNFTFQYAPGLRDFGNNSNDWWTLSIYTGTPGEPAGTRFTSSPE